MEIQRKYYEKISGGIRTLKRNGWFKRNLSPLGLYYHLCNYGEDWFKPFIYSVFVVVEFSIIYAMQTYLAEPLPDKSIQYLVDSFAKNLFAFFQIESKEYKTHIVRILAVPLLGTLIISLRRKLERRFRHQHPSMQCA